MDDDQYIVCEGRRVKFGGSFHESGTIIRVEPAHARGLLKDGAIRKPVNELAGDRLPPAVAPGGDKSNFGPGIHRVEATMAAPGPGEVPGAKRSTMADAEAARSAKDLFEKKKARREVTMAGRDKAQKERRQEAADKQSKRNKKKR